MRAIVLHSIKYSDSQRVVRMFTETHGLRAYLVRGFGAKKSTKTAVYQPFSLLEITEQEKRRGDLFIVKEERRAYAFEELPFHPLKASIAMFLSEMLERSIAEDHAHEQLFEYVWNAIQLLDLSETFGLFPIQFLGNLIAHLGLMPEPPKSGEFWLDLVTGTWEQKQPGHKETADKLLGESLVHAASSAQDSELTATRKGRKEVLDIQVRFLQLHVAGSRDIKSLAILKEVFA
ncbi:MAG: DNA repair protein RecO [Flavobacteriales bacterium]|nr:DNA repair protein RecO [Flavobacteriales bacterium]MDG1779573.1 DNA repair protein RecO [Flavobacteriales bacterium]MDG2245699.1 DNA repair protein RecO [Flavobacteriales bacterium]